MPYFLLGFMVACQSEAPYSGLVQIRKYAENQTDTNLGKKFAKLYRYLVEFDNDKQITLSN